MLDVPPMMIMTILTIFGHFIFKAHFDNFLEFLDSRTQEVNSKTPRWLSNETSLNVLRIFVTKLQPFSWEVFFPKVWQGAADDTTFGSRDRGGVP